MTAGAASGGNSPLAVIETSSIARPSSLLAMLKSVQRIQIVAPFGTDSPESVELTALRLPAALPSSAPAVAARLGLLKSSASTWVQVPVVSDVASVLYWKSSRSAAPPLVTPAPHKTPL